MRKVGAVILAAGGSSRFGQSKQLLVFRGETLVRRAVRAAREAGCDPIAVVSGEGELDEAGVSVVQNPQWQRGVGTSIRRGVEQLGRSIDAVVLMTCDQPFVDASLIERLISEHEKSGKPIVASSYANTVGVPALFHNSCLDALLSLPDEAGAKSLILSRRDDVAEVAFEQGAIDIDTPEDFARLSEVGLDSLMAEVTIEIIENGPYIVTGPVELKDDDGNVYPAKQRVALCRCGASTTKPFCDGTHSKIGFQAAERAVPESAEGGT